MPGKYIRLVEDICQIHETLAHRGYAKLAATCTQLRTKRGSYASFNVEFM